MEPGTPSGGKFTWTTNSDKIAVSNFTEDGATSEIKVTSIKESDSLDDVVIRLKYELNDRASIADIPITVQKPTFMGKLDVTANHATTDCSDLLGPGTSGAGWLKTISWQVLDKFGRPLKMRMPLYDTMTNSAPNSCWKGRVGEGTAAGKGTSNLGTWDHDYKLCSTACLRNGSCGLFGVQRYYVNGWVIDKKYVMHCNVIWVEGDGSTPLPNPPPPPRSKYVHDFVAYLWVGSVQHAPADVDLDNWSAVLTNAYAQGGATMLAQSKSLAASMFHSSEYIALNRSDEDFIRDLYQVYSQREPDEGGYNFWLGRLR